jgi:hypothetical protein
MSNLYGLLTEAAEQTAATLQHPTEDAAKWRHYLGLTKESQLEWRLREGHREFCRLQRLAFHCHI